MNPATHSSPYCTVERDCRVPCEAPLCVDNKRCADEPPKSRRGEWMRKLSPEERSERARKAGLASAKSPKHRRFSSEQASAAGKLGGAVVASRPGHMAEMGRAGGHATARARINCDGCGKRMGQPCRPTCPYLKFTGL